MTLERRAELAVKGEKWLSKDYTKLRQTWMLSIGRNSDRSIKSTSPNDYSYNKRFNGLK